MQLAYDLSEIDSIAEQVITLTSSTVILFHGNMGVGKTTLIQAIARHLGVEEIVSSPTFSIVNEYRTNKSKIVYHFDFYRIENSDEALDLGFEEYLEQGDWIFIEWPDKISEYLPNQVQNIMIEERISYKRELTLQLKS